MRTVTWSLYVGSSVDPKAFCTVTKHGEYTTKRAMVKAIKDLLGQRHSPIIKTAPHVYFTIPKKD